MDATAPPTNRLGKIEGFLFEKNLPAVLPQKHFGKHQEVLVADYLANGLELPTDAQM